MSKNASAQPAGETNASQQEPPKADENPDIKDAETK